MPRAVLLNDTYDTYHWGCTGTSAAVRRRAGDLGFDLIPVSITRMYGLAPLPQTSLDFDDRQFFATVRNSDEELFDVLAEADVVLINGEGTMHSLHQGSVALLYLAGAAQHHLGKPVQMINHSFYPDGVAKASRSVATQLYERVYRRLDFVAAREHFSHALLTQSSIAAELSFDCLPITIHEDYELPAGPRSPHLVVGGSASLPGDRIDVLITYMQRMQSEGFRVSVLIGAAQLPAREDLEFVDTLRRRCKFEWELVQPGSLKEWLDCVASATLLVSGRFHYTIAAAFLNTPCVVFESNTPKNDALCDCLGLPAPLRYSAPDLDDALTERSRRALEMGAVAPQALSSLREFAERNFDGLRRVA